jgi:small subunit ribosomal protein S1
VLKVGQVVRAQVLAIDPEKRQAKLSMKQLVPTSLDEYVAEHKAGDVVSGRVVEQREGAATVELGEGIRVTCRLREDAAASAERGRGFVFAELDAAGAMEGECGGAAGAAGGGAGAELQDCGAGRGDEAD